MVCVVAVFSMSGFHGFFCSVEPRNSTFELLANSFLRQSRSFKATQTTLPSERELKYNLLSSHSLVVRVYNIRLHRFQGVKCISGCDRHCLDASAPRFVTRTALVRHQRRHRRKKTNTDVTKSPLSTRVSSPVSPRKHSARGQRLKPPEWTRSRERCVGLRDRKCRAISGFR